MDDLDDDELAALRVDVEQLRADVADLRRLVDRHPRAPLTRADRATLSRLYPAITGAIGSTEFLGAEVLQLPAVQLVVPEWPARRLGCLLKKAIGVTVGGFVVEHLATEAHCAIWRVRAALPEFPFSGDSGTPPVRRRARVRSRS